MAKIPGLPNIWSCKLDLVNQTWAPENCMRTTAYWGTSMLSWNEIIFTWNSQQEMTIARQGLWLSKCKRSWLSKQISLFPGLYHILWHMAKKAASLSHIPLDKQWAAEQGITSEKGATWPNWYTGVGGYFWQFHPRSSCHFQLHCKSLLAPAVALRVLPMYRTRFYSEGEVELLISASPWLTLRGIFLPFHLGNKGFLRSMLVWKNDWPKELALHKPLLNPPK